MVLCCAVTRSDREITPLESSKKKVVSMCPSCALVTGKQSPDAWPRVNLAGLGALGRTLEVPFQDGTHPGLQAWATAAPPFFNSMSTGQICGLWFVNAEISSSLASLREMRN